MGDIEKGRNKMDIWHLWGVAEICGLPREFFTIDWGELAMPAVEDADAVLDEAETLIEEPSPAESKTPARESRGAGG